MTKWNDTGQKLKAAAKKYWYLLLLLILAVVLLVWPASDEPDPTGDTPAYETNEYSLRETEQKMRDIISKIEGCGKTEVMLTLKASGQRVLAEDKDYSEGETGNVDSTREVVIIQAGTSQEAVVVLKQYYPVYQGALVVCEGASDPSVRLRVIEAVRALTGLGTDRITVSAMKKD
ncbi:MAG: hypothetical protein GXX89_02960 [Clostridiales bacterium]|jgi:stage III sporulation protein AG|nr:hypothetical protein [Clostridiales bacterium]